MPRIVLSSLVPLQETQPSSGEDLPGWIRAPEGRRLPLPFKAQFTLLPKPSTQQSSFEIWDSHLNLLNCDVFPEVIPQSDSELRFPDRALVPPTRVLQTQEL